MSLAPIGAMATRQEKKPSKILSIDIGGSKVKFLATGETEPRKIASGKELSPSAMVEEVRRATRGWKYNAVSIGIPGPVGPNGPVSEPGNLGSGWVGFDYAAAFECPVRIVNDAAMQALGSYDGGRMLFLGLGTGLGSVLIVDHTVVPLELGELAYKPGHTLSSRLGRAAFRGEGQEEVARARAGNRAFPAARVPCGLRGARRRQREEARRAAAARAPRGERERVHGRLPALGRRDRRRGCG